MLINTYFIKGIKIFSITGLCLLALNSCTDTTDLFNPDSLEELYKNNFPVETISENTDWKTVREVYTDILIDYDYNIDNKYLIEIFDNNPISSENPIRLDYTYVSKTINNRYSANLCLPFSSDSISVCVTDPFGRRIVKEVVVKDNRLECTFSDKAIDYTRKNITIESSFTMPEMPYYSNIPENSIELSEWIMQNPWNGLPSDTNFKITKDINTFPNHWGSYNTKIFVAAEWIMNTQQIQNGLEIIVMPTGVIKESNNNGISVAGNSGFSIMEGGQLNLSSLAFKNNGIFNNAGKAYISGDFTVDNPMQIINYGQFIVKKYCDNAYSSDACIYNTGEFESGLSFYKNGGMIYNSNQFYSNKSFEMGSNAKCINDGYLKTEDFKINWSSASDFSMQNNCKIEVYNFYVSGAKIFFGYESSFTADKFIDFNQTQLFMEAGSYLNSKEITFEYGNNIAGTGNTKALIKSEKITKKDNTNNLAVTYSGNLQICTDKHFSNKNNQYIMTGNTDMVGYNNNTVTIPQSKCSEGVNPDTGEPGDPEAGGSDILKYTFAFEDTFPQMGDYDMNDYVADVWVDNYIYTESGKITGATIYLKSRAVGASKRLGLGLNLEGFSKSDISSVSGSTNTLESNGNLASIIVSSDLHQFIGAETRNLYNTIPEENNGYYFEPFTSEFKLRFSQEVEKERINIDKIDLYIYTGAPLHRVETHLNGKKNTHLASNSERYDEYIKKYTWALCIPDFKYPVEGRKITVAYPEFELWASDPDNYHNWYKNPVSDHLYSK